MFYAGEVVGEYEIVWCGPITLLYRSTGTRKQWRTEVHQFEEWMVLKGHYRRRCGGQEHK